MSGKAMTRLLTTALLILAVLAGTTVAAGAQDGGSEGVSAQNESWLIGGLDSVTPQRGHVAVSGWGVDTNFPGDPAHVDITINGRFVIRLTANVNRSDLAPLGYGTHHGFAASLGATPGPATVCAFVVQAINPPAFPNAPDTDLGCRTVTVPGGGPTPDFAGSFDGLSGGAGTFNIVGWGIDLNNETIPTNIDVYVNGVFRERFKADVDRPDVGAAYPAAGPNHGFNRTYDEAPGSVRVCVYVVGAVNPPPAPNAPDKDLGCKNATVVRDNPPFGSLDSVTPSAGLVTIAGWVINPTSPTMNNVAVWINGHSRGVLPATILRTDVNAAWGVTGDHGFMESYSVPAGPTTVCVYAMNSPANDFNPLIRCETVTVPSGSEPFGSFDGVSSPGPGEILAGGWMINPNRETVPGQVAVYVNGANKGWFTADTSRPDVAAAHPGAGPDHGFEVLIGGQAAGQHTVCIYAINWPQPVDNVLLGCKTITI